MNKLLALACATSVLALASGANAQTTTYAVALSGTVTPYCNITTAAAAPVTLSGNSTGGLASFSGSQTVNVVGNASCYYNLGTANAGLKGANTSAIVPYTASLTGSVEGAKTLGTDVSAATTNFNSTLPVAAGAITINWSGAGATSLAPDTYSDTLTLTVFPHA